jgi:hypothetical protein
VIALAAPLGPLIGFFLGDRLERKWIICAQGMSRAVPNRVGPCRFSSLTA